MMIFNYLFIHSFVSKHKIRHQHLSFLDFLDEETLDKEVLETMKWKADK